ncbi:MAG: TatD family deoxyribonuclease [Actinobacteria bacterium]|nr:TatD family deoxyribonuclease [Actinomycetota bacterium]
MEKNNKPSYFIDTHAHLDMLKNMTPETAVKNSLAENVKYIINPGSSLEGSIKSCQYSNKFEAVYSSVGVHPHDAETFDKRTLSELEKLVKGNKKVIAIGETGFDYYRNLSPKNDQENAFISQIELALKYNLPVIVHDREAHSDTLKILKSCTGSLNAVIHCFSGSTDFALKCLEMGFFISFTGVITFPNAKELVQTVKEVPIERLFLETDAPFLAPQERRGQENYPGFVKYIAAKIADIKGLSVDEVARITSVSARKFFKLN